MRRTPAARDNIVPLLEAFNFIGSRTHPHSWDSSEAVSVRLGQRKAVASESRRRGLSALRTMRSLAENGTINIIYSDDQRRRVPYFQSAGYWLTAIYPDPVGTGEGLIELDDRHLHPCVVDVSRIIQWRVPTSQAKPGPKRRFEPFYVELDEYFSCNSTSKQNKEVIYELAHLSIEWPRGTMLHQRINEARDRALARNRSTVIPD